MPRPAGMSDDEEDDNDGFSFGSDNHSSLSDVPVEGTLCNNVSNVNDEKKRIPIENHIINACITGVLHEIMDGILDYDALYGEDITNKNLHTGWTLLLYATSSVQSELVEYLLDHEADPNKHKDGFTPLMALCNSTKGTDIERLRCLELLIKAKVDVNVVNKRRETALMYACKSQDAEFVTNLIEHVKNVNVCDSDGKTALSYATVANKLDNVMILLEYNADISLADRHNTSAKDIADAKGFKEISALLADDEEDISTFCEVSQIRSWKDLFPDLYPRKKKTLDYDISVMLEGMGLQEYGILFQEMNLKTFLQLTEDDLCRLGIDITVHKEQFLQSLERFHNKIWYLNSLGRIKKSDRYTIYNGIIALTTARKHIGVIASSFQYIKNNYIKATNENIHLSPAQEMNYEKELRKVQNTLRSLKNEITQVKKLAKKINKENNFGVPATFISSKKSNSNWITVTLSVTVMVGLYVYKTACIQRSWSTRYNTFF